MEDWTPEAVRNGLADKPAPTILIANFWKKGAAYLQVFMVFFIAWGCASNAGLSLSLNCIKQDKCL